MSYVKTIMTYIKYLNTHLLTIAGYPMKKINMPKVISNILPKKLNKEIIKILTNTKGWYFGNDTNLPLEVRLEEVEIKD